MKAYLFIETGEIRQPKAGEYFSISSGVLKCVADRVVMPSPILTRHEIEIPEGANGLTLVPYDGAIPQIFDRITIPLPRPKKKVKKTVYLSVRYYDGHPTYSVYDINEPPEGSYPVEIEVEE